MPWATYLSVYVVAGAIACIAGYQRLPITGYRGLLVATLTAGAAHAANMLGPPGWLLGPLAVAGVITLMAWSEACDGEPPGLPQFKEAAIRLWRWDAPS